MDPAVAIATILGGYSLNVIGTMFCAITIAMRRETILIPLGLVLNIFGVISMGVGFYVIMVGPGW